MRDPNRILYAQSYLRHRHSILFYTLLVTLVAGPLINALKLSGTLFESLLAVSLLAAIMPDPVKGHRLLLVLMVVAWPARLLAVWIGHHVLSAMTLGLWTVIGLLAAARALRFAMRAAKVDAEHLYAALSAYLLAGFCFGLLYWVLEQLSTGAFAASGGFSQASAIYFSFVTLATLGYGDITPRAELARGLAIKKAFAGNSS